MKEKLPMRVLSVSGISTSGKTTLVVEIVKELTKRGYRVGTIKSIGCGRHCQAHVEGRCDGSSHLPGFGFSIDTKGKNSFKHKEAGAEQTGTWAKSETALIYPYRMEVSELIDRYDYDFLVIEGGREYALPRITTGIDEENTMARLTKTTIAVSGKVADQYSQINGIETYKTFEDIEKLVDLIEEKVQPAIAFKDHEGCNMCGKTCEELAEEIIAGKKDYKACKRAYPDIEISSDNPEVKEKIRRFLVQLRPEDIPENIRIKY